MRRRDLLAQGFMLSPLATMLLAACAEKERWPDGMAAFTWDRDTCARCGMVISDRRFAAQVRGGPKNMAIHFDDIGCAATWCAEKHKDHAWLDNAATRIWVAAFDQAPASGQAPQPGSQRWLDARDARYLKGKRSPMGYNFAAYAEPRAGSINFDTMSHETAATWPANCSSAASAP